MFTIPKLSAVEASLDAAAASAAKSAHNAASLPATPAPTAAPPAATPPAGATATLQPAVPVRPQQTMLGTPPLPRPPQPASRLPSAPRSQLPPPASVAPASRLPTTAPPAAVVAPAAAGGPPPLLPPRSQLPPPLLPPKSQLGTDEVPATSFQAAFAHTTQSKYYKSMSAAAAAVGTAQGAAPIITKEDARIRPELKLHPVCKFIRNITYKTDPSLAADFASGQTCVLFLSLRHHLLHPTEVIQRINEIGNTFTLRVLLVLIDTQETPDAKLHDLSLEAAHRGFAFILAWSQREAARWLETFHVRGNSPATDIMPRVQEDFGEMVADCLTAARSVHKSDVAVLMATFGSLDGIAHASVEQLAEIPGMGEKKVRRLFDAFHKPFFAPLPTGLGGPAPKSVRTGTGGAPAPMPAPKASPSPSPPPAGPEGAMLPDEFLYDDDEEEE